MPRAHRLAWLVHQFGWSDLWRHATLISYFSHNATARIRPTHPWTGLIDRSWAVASLGWVTLGAATEGVTPLFYSEKKLATFLVITVSTSCAVSPLFIFSCDDLFC